MTVRDMVRKTGAGWARPIAGRLGRRLLVGILLLALVPLAVSNGVGYLRSTTIIEGLVERYLEGIADLQSIHVRDQLARHILILREVASHDAIRGSVSGGNSLNGDRSNLSGMEVDPFIDGRLAEHPAFEALYLFTADGDIVASAPLPPADLGFFIGPPLKKPERVVEIVRDPEPPRPPRLRLAVRVGGVSDQELYLGGYVEVLGPSKLLDIPEHTAGSVETFIVDEHGVPLFISHPHGFVDFGEPLETPLLERPLRSSVVYADRQGVEVIGTIVAVPGYPWRLLTEVPVADALRELRQLRAWSVWLATLLALIVVALAWAMAGRIVAPVRRLVLATRRLAAGDPGARVDVGGRDEIAELGTAFNEMATDLARTSARIEQLHERELARAGQLATVGELASGVAHEIKNPIEGISGGFDLVMKYTKQDELLDPIVKEMRRQVNRVQMAVKDLLAFARPAQPTFALADVNETVQRALTLVRPTAESAKVHLEVELGPVPCVRMDEEMIRQALVNLVVNGVQATPEGGRVTVTSRLAGEGEVEIGVSDTGRGIPADQLDHIFKPFFTTRHQGTGLGLSITQSTIERHGGTLTIESRVGAGTTFRVVLPARGNGAP